MTFCKIITALFIGAALCAAQTVSVNISGVVLDTADEGIPGATVTLEEAGISTTTGEEGFFNLTGSVSVLEPNVKSRTLAERSFQLQNGKITFTLTEDTHVGISIHDLRGRQIYNNKKTYSSGTHAIETPLQSSGIYLFNVSVGKESYTFKSSTFGTFSTGGGSFSGGTSVLSKQAETSDVIADVISVSKEGWLDYRDSIRTSEVVIQMIPNAGNVTDADGNVYQSVKIGDQVWTVENLRTTQYNDSSAIGKVTDYHKWENLGTGAYCYYDNDSASYAEKYGALYNWHAVNTGKLAPEGWHVPTDAEWDTLENYLIANGYNWDGSMTGDKIGKSLAAKTDWSYSSTAGAVGNDLANNNRTGFSALPGGSRINTGYFGHQSYYGTWWSATEVNAFFAYYRHLDCNYEYLSRFLSNKKHGFSVRLVRDN